MYNKINKNIRWGINNMKPRIFVSSTFYDLKYIREELSNYIKVHDFEPIMFEDSDIGYTPGRPLDESCYDAMRSADMVVLIIGGEYGSVASEDSVKDFEEYISVTRKEFRTALESGIPIFCMIDSNVNTEYGVYDANSENIEDNGLPIKFKTTKNINVFRFIKEIRTFGSIPIQEFKNVSEIKEFLGKQWADMFKNYLGFLKNRTESRKLENTVKEMSNLMRKMDIMLSNVGKNILSNPKDYENVINQQDIFSLCSLISDSFEFYFPNDEVYKSDFSEREKITTKILNILKEAYQKGYIGDSGVGNDKIDLFFDLFSDNGILVFNIEDESLSLISNKQKLLYDENNIKDMAKIMAQNEYFHKFIKSL